MIGGIFEEIGFKNEINFIEKIQRFNSKTKNSSVQTTTPIRIQMENTDYEIKSYLKGARALKNSASFKNVFLTYDLTQTQRKHLKELIKVRNEKNQCLTNDATFRYGYLIRDDKVVKIQINK